jgi:hypothetical protein
MMNFLGSAVAVAGIGAVGFAIFYLLCREIIRQKIFPNLTKQQAYQIIRLIIILAFVVSMAGLIAWLYDKSPYTPVAKLEWVKEKQESESALWKLKITGAPISNLDIESIEYLSLGSDNDVIMSTSWPLRTNDTVKSINFLQVDSDIETILKSLNQENIPWLMHYTFLAKATYDNDITGAKFEKVWDFSFSIDNEITFWSNAAKAEASTTSQYDYVKSEHKKIDDCGRTFNGPGTIALLSVFPDAFYTEYKLKRPKAVDWNAVANNKKCVKI